MGNWPHRLRTTVMACCRCCKERNARRTAWLDNGALFCSCCARRRWRADAGFQARNNSLLESDGRNTANVHRRIRIQKRQTKPSETPQLFEEYTDPREKTNVRSKPEKIPWFSSLTDRDKRAASGLLTELDARLVAKHYDMYSTYLETIVMGDDATDFAGGSTHPPSGWSPPSGTWVPVSFK